MGGKAESCNLLSELCNTSGKLRGKTTDAVEILKRRYGDGNPEMQAYKTTYDIIDVITEKVGDYWWLDDDTLEDIEEAIANIIRDACNGKKA